MTHYEDVRSEYKLPFELYPFQIDAVNELAALDKTGVYLDPGLGKTAVSTHNALYKRSVAGKVTTLVVVPPILVTSWVRWLAKVSPANGAPFKILAYQGSPKQRAAMNLIDQDFIVMSMQIFKRDYARLTTEFDRDRLQVILDEAHCIKDVGTDNYKKFRDFTYDVPFQMLTGTPLNKPEDCYAYVKLKTPNVYRSLAMFERIHVAKRDFFDKPIEFQNLDLLTENLMLQAVRKSKEDVLHDLPEAIISQLEYELDPAHMKLYRELVEDQLLKLPDGDKIDATEATALYHALGQIVCQWHHFGQDEALVSAGYNLIDEVIEELDGKKLVVFANYKRTNQYVVKRFGCPGIWGDIPPKEKQRAWDRFLDDPSCKLITLNPVAAGLGLDGAQHVCADVLYLEPPIAVSHWVQSLSRVHREGQKQVVTIRMATALRTIQEHLVRSLTAKEDLVQPLQGSRAMLRAALLGG